MKEFQEKKQNDIITYADRCILTNKFIQWCYKTNALTSLENFFVYLEMNGMINTYKVNKFLKK